jgi:hypothetical protein
MADIPTWELLSAATELVMAEAELSKDQAQTKICDAIADGTLKFQAKVGRHMIRPMDGNRVLEEKDFHISRDIQPEDFDWEQSRPLKLWNVRHEIFKLPGLWNLEWIKVCRADITKLCTVWSKGDAVQHGETSATNTSRPALRSTGARVGSAPRSTAGPQTSNAAGSARRRGARPKKTEQVKGAMRNDIQQGRLTAAALKNMLEKNLAENYGVSRDTARKARNAVLLEFGEN